MTKDLNVIKAFNLEVDEENIIALTKNHEIFLPSSNTF